MRSQFSETRTWQRSMLGSSCWRTNCTKTVWTICARKIWNKYKEWKSTQYWRYCIWARPSRCGETTDGMDLWSLFILWSSQHSWYWRIARLFDVVAAWRNCQQSIIVWQVREFGWRCLSCTKINKTVLQGWRCLPLSCLWSVQVSRTSLNMCKFTSWVQGWIQFWVQLKHLVSWRWNQGLQTKSECVLVAMKGCSESWEPRKIKFEQSCKTNLKTSQ